MRDLAFRLEALLLRLLLAVLSRLPPETASNLGGAVARAIGPLLPVSRVAEDNLRCALPHLDRAERRRILRGVWENLGRTAGEFAHVRCLGPTPSGPGWEVVGAEQVARIREAGRPVVLVSGHLGNWEVTVAAATRELGRRIALLYRAATNPYAEAIIQACRQDGMTTFLPKGAAGARGALTVLRSGGVLGMLIDQKMNDGISVPFFGRQAMTAPAAAAMALRFDALLVPAVIRRIGPARFRVIVEAPLDLPDSGDRHADIAALTLTLNQRLERWIRECPEQWLWLHRRWPTETA
jgi:KDO2-lipid IV(A) lauroyltransferase